MNLDLIRQVGMINECVLMWGINVAQAGMTKLELDNLVELRIKERGGEPAFKGYQGYKFATCIAVNHEIVHGVPNNYKFKPGDLVTLDCGVKLDNHYVDAARSFIIEPDEERDKVALNMIIYNQLCLDAAADCIKEGLSLLEISRSAKNVPNNFDFKIFHQFCGHGIGNDLHLPPNIPHAIKGKCFLPTLKAGQVICLEPIITAGLTLDPILDEDGWTMKAADGALTCHIEHTVIVHEDRGEIVC